jgi:putative hydroxymethylpyrimidine transport system substrate-binding protein
MTRALLPLAVTIFLAVFAAACGEDDEPTAAREPRTVDVALDFTPNPVHAPIFAARRTGADEANGVRLRIREPGGDGPDSLQLVESGRVLVGVLDIHDLAIAREKGVDVVGVGALVQKPLAGLLAQEGVRRPRDLAGRTVGVSGLPSDPAFLRAIVEQDGGDYESIRQVTIGFKAVSALVARRVAAVPAFWNVEGVILEQRGVPLRQFGVEDYGAPAYPEVVFITARKTLQERRGDVEATMRAVAAGVEEVLARPDAAVREIADEAGADDLDLVRAQLDVVKPLFRPAIRLDRDVLERWADFDARIGLVKRRPQIDRAFDLSVAAAGA